jgi:hypothetical protein
VPLRERAQENARHEDDLFYFLQCATVATPGTEDWPLRAREEAYALRKFTEYLRFLENNEWFTLQPTGEDRTRWTGTVRSRGRSWDVELVFKDAYPHIPPACRIPELMHYTDRKLEDPQLGLRICDMHMETHYWWDEHCSLALYLKREVSYWVEAVVQMMVQKGWL